MQGTDVAGTAAAVPTQGDTMVEVKGEAPFSFTRKKPDGTDMLTCRGYTFEEFMLYGSQLFGGQDAWVRILQEFQIVQAPPPPPPAQTNGQVHPASVAAPPQAQGVPAAAPPPQGVPAGAPAQQPQATGFTCPQCGQGQVVVKNRRNNQGTFQGCNRYPNCDYIYRPA